MKKILKSKGKYIRHIEKDGNCLFKACADQLGDQFGGYTHLNIRDIACDLIAAERHLYAPYMADEEEVSFDDQIKTMRQGGQWWYTSECWIKALAVITQRCVQVLTYDSLTNEKVDVIEHGVEFKSNDTHAIVLLRSFDNHFDSVHNQTEDEPPIMFPQRNTRSAKLPFKFDVNSFLSQNIKWRAEINAEAKTPASIETSNHSALYSPITALQEDQQRSPGGSPLPPELKRLEGNEIEKPQPSNSSTHVQEADSLDDEVGESPPALINNNTDTQVVITSEMVDNDITEDNVHDGKTSFTVLYQDQDDLCERVATLQPFQNVSTTTTYNQILYTIIFVRI
jgi:hypothetical protein